MEEKSISKIQFGSNLFQIKDEDLRSMAYRISELEDLDENANTEEIAQKINEILGQYRLLLTYTIGHYDDSGDFYLISNFYDNFDGTATVGVSCYGDQYLMEVE